MLFNNEEYLSLANALGDEKEYIEIKGELASDVVRIKAIGTIAWTASMTCMRPIVALNSSPFVLTERVFLLGSPLLLPVYKIMGTAAMPAVRIAMAAGNAYVLKLLRKYKIVTEKAGYVLLKRV